MQGQESGVSTKESGKCNGRSEESEKLKHEESGKFTPDSSFLTPQYCPFCAFSPFNANKSTERAVTP